MKKKLLALLLAVMMVAAMLPLGASAGEVTAEGDTVPSSAKIKVEYYNGEELLDTSYFDNASSDDYGVNPDNPEQHGYQYGDGIWDPVQYAGNVIPNANRVVVTLLKDITLEDTTILADNGINVTIKSDGSAEQAYKITSTLSGTVETGANGAHVGGNDAISVPTGGSLTLDNVKVEVKTKGEGQGDYATQGAYVDGSLTLTGGATLSVSGVSQGGVNGSTGTVELKGENTALTVTNSGSSGVHTGSVIIGSEAEMKVEDAGGHGVSVDTLKVDGTLSAKGSLYGVYGNDITVNAGGELKAESDADVDLYIPNGGSLTVNGTLGPVSDDEGATLNYYAGTDTKISTGTNENVEQITDVVAVYEATTYKTLAAALTEAAKSGGTITLLADIEREEMYVEVGKNVTINGAGHNVTLIPKEGWPGGDESVTTPIYMWAEADLTLNNVTVTVDGTDKATASGIALMDGSDLILNNATLNLNNLARGIQLPGYEEGKGRKVSVTNGSTLTGSNITGNFSNGIDLEVTDGSTVKLDNITDNGLSVNSLTVDGSTVTVDGAGRYGITAEKGVTLKNGANATVTNSGTNTDTEGAIRVVAGALNIDNTSSLTASGTDTKSSNIVVGADASVENQGTITGDVVLPTSVEDGKIRVDFYAYQGGSLVSSKEYDEPGSGETTVKIDVPAAPTRSGYTFRNWTLDGTPLTVEEEKATITVNEDVTVYKVYGNWTRNTTPGGGGSTGTTYDNTVATATNGSATVTDAKAGETATITATPDKGYKVGTVTVRDESGNNVTVTGSGNRYTFTQPEGKVTVTVTFVWDNPFTDVTDPDQWYYGAVEYVNLNGLMNGTSTTAFSPNSGLTRAQVAQVLYNLENTPAVTGESTFTDVTDTNQWYYEPVLWAQQNGVVNGYEDNTFKPNERVTRQEFAKMMYNYAQFKGFDLTAQGDLSRFPDSNQVGGWATQALSWANGEGVINGSSEGSSVLLLPTGTTTRAQAAQILMNFHKNVVL